MSIDVVVLGDLPIAAKVLDDLLMRKGVRVRAVIARKRMKEGHPDPWSDPCLYDRARQVNLPLYSTTAEFMASVGDLKVDFGFVCRFSEVLAPQFLRLFSCGVINMHGGVLPERAGLNISCHCLLLGDEYGGGTLHFIDDGIDTGDIIAVRRFLLEPDDTSFSVFQKTELALWRAYQEHIVSILDGSVARTPQSAFSVPRRYFSRKSLDSFREVDPEKMATEEIDRRARAFSFPGHEPAYFVYRGHRVYLQVSHPEVLPPNG